MMIETSVKFIRLVTGEDIISEVTYIETDRGSHYVLNNPMKVMYMTNGKSTTLSVSLLQWIFWRICDTQDFIVQDKDILVVSNTSPSMEEYYWSTVEHLESYKEKMISSETETVLEEEDQENDPDETLSSIIEMLKETKGTIH